MGIPATIDQELKTPASPNSPPDRIEDDPRWLVAQRVVVSRHFARSRLLSKFLLYIVDETLHDRQNEITEHQIGVQVFDRPPSYRSVEDNIVRTYARHLRRRLAEYFAGEGTAEQIHIEIPLGGYVPIFVTAPSRQGRAERDPAQTQDKLSLPAGEPTIPWIRKAKTVAWLAVYSAILACLVWLVAVRFNAPRPAPVVASPTRELWAELLGGPANCYIVPADAGFNLVEDISRHPSSLADYMRGSYLTLPLPHVDEHSADDLRNQQFTSFIDLKIVTSLSRLPEFNPQRDILRFPRDLQIDDLKNANAVILGSVGSNPWATIDESGANFRIVYREGMQGAIIENASPQPGEQATYISRWSEPAHETFAIVAYRPNLGGNGHILLLQGLDVAGTQAASEMLFQPDVIAPILQRATRPDGSLRYFEILLRSTSIESNATRAQVIGSRIY